MLWVVFSRLVLSSPPPHSSPGRPRGRLGRFFARFMHLGGTVLLRFFGLLGGLVVGGRLQVLFLLAPPSLFLFIFAPYPCRLLRSLPSAFGLRPLFLLGGLFIFFRGGLSRAQRWLQRFGGSTPSASGFASALAPPPMQRASCLPQLHLYCLYPCLLGAPTPFYVFFQTPLGSYI